MSEEEAPVFRTSFNVTPNDVMRQRFEVEIAWIRQADADGVDDWGAVIATALHEEGCCVYDMRHGPVEVLGHSREVPAP